ncbi:cell division protein ZapE [Dickeya fangzhongdai]|uniref:Cell division protein ZapE n=1 Tax=Dickeya fangzhongdai TaxID=1778540 RepID=A0A2K8QH75_9GAMM|nr:cell division protein ZapE [Dickeya fangzhongdai]ATZ92792.1 cell division protein ZapE [Dickeya fangzhongdai]MBO8132718.1 AFG1 family ATPase [Dickeya fangzhongdai]QOH46220.1 cell division protein ZapE [Dickeya fangzhongdai]QOH50528.1 cell division protein ZapE [Dickeya fangzhongdai]WES90554.1 cell division protein ZapE [Dickeya fangzhongdai]
MQRTTPLALYQQALAAQTYQPDEVQHQTVIRLNAIHQTLTEQVWAPAESSAPGLMAKWRAWIGHKEKSPSPVQGLYMWGGVGRGKTWLMDLFFHSLPSERKLRLHFHRFMLRVHEELNQLQGQENPLEKVADGFKAQTDILCFDEFFVSDITDAMLLAELLRALFSRGIALVATSNIPPDELYRNGLQRARFLPAIELIKQHCAVLNVDAGIDYRLRTLTQAHLYLTPNNADTDAEMQAMFRRLSGRDFSQPGPVLEINHRPLATLSAGDGVLAVDFATLCLEARSQNDYIALSRLYHTVLLHHVPVMEVKDENAARRFLALVDEFYERRVKLIMSAQATMFEIYQGEHLKFEYQRCLSRLQEMQSEEYLRQPHLP